MKAPAGPVHYFPVKVGARWVYEFASGDQTEVVTHVRRTDDAVIVTVGNELSGGKVTPLHTMALRADGLYMLDEIGKPYDPPMRVLKLPVKVGDRWEGTSSRQDLGRIKYAREVKEVKELKTPAGTFQAVGIEAGWASAAARELGKDRYWYAPEVGLLQIEGVRILKAFTPGKD